MSGSFFLLLRPVLHRSYKGISDHRQTKREIRNRVGERVQCDRTTSNFRRTLRRARETWHHCRSIWRIYRRLAGRVPQRASGFQSLSSISHPKLGRGERSEHTVGIQDPLSNKIYRFCGDGCRRGEGYLIKTFCHSSAWT